MKLSRRHLVLITASLIGTAAIGAGIVVPTGINMRVAKVSPSKVSPAATQSPKPQGSASPESAAPASTTPTPTNMPAPSSGPSSRPKPTPLYIPPPSVGPIPLTFHAGRIDTAYASCSNGALSYTLGGVNIYVNQVTNTPFSWRIELSDGTVSDSGTDVMPNGAFSWSSFPSTYDYPSMLGTINNAEDGDMARLVITSPNYSAGAWSTAVPAGSVDACRNGRM